MGHNYMTILKYEYTIWYIGNPLWLLGYWYTSILFVTTAQRQQLF